jgi:RNA polymerase sigma factor (sigma-70 family)
MQTERSDETLMLLYKDGDIAAFNELYRRHARGLYSFINWRSPRREWVDEVMQETWASLHNARARYQPQSSFRTFLFQIANNKLVDYIRANHKTTLASDLGENGDGTQIFDNIVDTTERMQETDAGLEQKQRMDWLRRAVAMLPGEQREALALQQFSGMSLSEIAELTATPVETIKSRLRYAMQKLRQHAQMLTEGEQI